MSKAYLCRDINGGVHVVEDTSLIKRTSVYGVVRNGDDIVLVRDRTSDETWDLPGGGIETGENILVALSREIREETGLTLENEPVKICEFIEYFYDIDTKTGWESTRHFYKIACTGNLTVGGNNDDITEAKYINIESLDHVSSVAKEIIRLSTNR